MGPVETGWQETGNDKTFSFKASGGVTRITNFSSGTNHVGKLTKRKAIWVAHCDGDASSYIQLVFRYTGETTPTIDDGSSQGFMTRLLVGNDDIYHIKPGMECYALSTSVTDNSIVRVVEIG